MVTTNKTSKKPAQIDPAFATQDVAQLNKLDRIIKINEAKKMKNTKKQIAIDRIYKALADYTREYTGLSSLDNEMANDATYEKKDVESKLDIGETTQTPVAKSRTALHLPGDTYEMRYPEVVDILFPKVWKELNELEAQR